jgi:hypothetical protein
MWNSREMDWALLEVDPSPYTNNAIRTESND